MTLGMGLGHLSLLVLTVCSRKSSKDKHACHGLCCEVKTKEDEDEEGYVLTQMQSGDGQTIGAVLS